MIQKELEQTICVESTSQILTEIEEIVEKKVKEFDGKNFYFNSFFNELKERFHGLTKDLLIDFLISTQRCTILELVKNRPIVVCVSQDRLSQAINIISSELKDLDLSKVGDYRSTVLRSQSRIQSINDENR